MAQIPNSVRVGGFIAPSDTGDTYPSHDAIYGKGGLRESDTTTTRDAIPDARRSEGMLVYVKADEKVYQLKGGITNSDWVDFSTQGSDGEDGNTILNGTGAPSVGDGVAGDFWIDTSNTVLYGPKDASTGWPATGTNLIGADGQDGQDGLPGQDGQDGAAATISIGSVTTGDAGTDAAVTNSGTSTAATFDFTIPQGDAGANGADGLPGEDGVDGKTILNGTSDPGAGDGSEGDFWINTNTNYIWGPKGATSWPASGVSIVGPTTFKSFADTNARELYDENRAEGFTAYMEDTNKMFVYKNALTGNENWANEDNWVEIALGFDEYSDLETSDLLSSLEDDYYFGIYDNTTGFGGQQFKRYDLNSFFGYITQSLAQSLIDADVITEDEISFGAGNVLGDLNGDGAVGTADLLLLLSYFGNTAGDNTVSVNSFASFNNISGTHLSTASGYTANSWKTIPLSPTGFTAVKNGFEVTLSDADDYFSFSDGSVVSVSGTWFSSNNKSLWIGKNHDAGAPQSPLPDAVTFRVTTTSFDVLIFRAIITVINSVGDDSEIIQVLTGTMNISEPVTNYDIETDIVDVANQIASYVNSNTTDIRIHFQARATVGNVSSVKLYDGAVRLSN